MMFQIGELVRKAIAIVAVLAGVLFFGAQSAYANDDPTPTESATPTPSPTPSLTVSTPALAEIAKTCDLSYKYGPGDCLPVHLPGIDKNCKDLKYQVKLVDVNNDPYNLDRDKDGIGCERNKSWPSPTKSKSPSTTNGNVLPVTGSNGVPIVIGSGIALLLLGGVIVVLSRRRARES